MWKAPGGQTLPKLPRGRSLVTPEQGMDPRPHGSPGAAWKQEQLPSEQSSSSVCSLAGIDVFSREITDFRDSLGHSCCLLHCRDPRGPKPSSDRRRLPNSFKALLILLSPNPGLSIPLSS